MIRKVIPGAAALAAIIAVGAVAAPVAHASTPATVIHPSDLIAALSSTNAAGHVSFRTDGLNVKTDDVSGKAAEYFGMTGPIPTSGSLAWRGTDTKPGLQIVFDADGTNGNGNDWNILVGEQSFYGDSWWLTPKSSQTAKDADPSGPDNNGGNGSAYFGTLADWAQNLPEARVYAAGFSLGSGAKGDGVIDAMTYGETTYNFSSITPAAPVVKTVANVRGSSAITVRPHGVRVDLRSQPQPDNTVLGRKLHWVVKVDGHTVLNVRQGFGAHDVARQHLATGSGKHRIQVLKNGVLVRNKVVKF